MKSFTYALKVWQTGVMVSPLIIVIFFCLQDETAFNDALCMLIAGIILGFLFSIPSFILFWIATYLVANKYLKWGNKKVVLSFFGAALTLLAFSLYGHQQGIPRSEAGIIVAYSIVIVTSTWLYS